MAIEHRDIGFIGLALVFGFCFGGVLYGLWHDFTPEYEATHQYGDPQYVYEEQNEFRHAKESRNFVIQGNKVVALTALDQEGLRIQDEQGCQACHPK